MSCFLYPELYKAFRDHVSDEYIDEYTMFIKVPDYEGDNPIENTGHDNIGNMYIKYTDGIQRPIPEIEPIIININQAYDASSTYHTAGEISGTITFKLSGEQEIYEDFYRISPISDFGLSFVKYFKIFSDGTYKAPWYGPADGSQLSNLPADIFINHDYVIMPGETLFGGSMPIILESDNSFVTNDHTTVTVQNIIVTD